MNTPVVANLAILETSEPLPPASKPVDSPITALDDFVITPALAAALRQGIAPKVKRWQYPVTTTYSYGKRSTTMQSFGRLAFTATDRFTPHDRVVSKTDVVYVRFADGHVQRETPRPWYGKSERRQVLAERRARRMNAEARRSLALDCGLGQSDITTVEA